MEKPIVLAIHGMGTHKPGNIADEIKKGLTECCSFFDEDSFDADNEFEFREFNYSDYLDEVRKEWSDEAKAISDFIGAGPVIVQKIYALQSKLNDDSFLYTHWLDVVTYCLLGTLRETILSRCIETILATVKEARDDPENLREVILLGHSLGTAVLHDSITKLYAKRDEPDTATKIKFTNYPISGLWTIANVSRMTQLLTRLEDPNHSIARDDDYPQFEGMSYQFYPVYNQYDPFTVFKRFALDPQWGDLIRTNEIRDLGEGDFPFNPHSLVEYLADPEVGGVFLSQFSTLNFSTSQMQEAKKKYKKTTVSGPISDALDEVKAAMRELDKQTGNTATLLAAVTKIIELYELIKKAYDIMKDGKGKG